MILRKRLMRRAFTLVELLVAMALITLIMSILSQAFVEGLESFRHLKATGDLQENLRTATIPIRTDLISRHFSNDDKLSSLPGRPTGGFFRIEGMQAPVLEGLDDYQLPSYRADTHAFHMTVRKLGARREDFFSGDLPATAPTSLQNANTFARNFGEAPNPNTGASGSFLSLEAEVSYFLAVQRGPDGLPMYASIDPTVQPNARLYALYRRQKLLVSQQVAGMQGGSEATFPDLSARVWPRTSAVLQFNRMEDLKDYADMGRRGLSVSDPNFPGYIDRNVTGTDALLIPDVLSMTIEVMRGDSYEFQPVHLAFPQRQASPPGVPQNGVQVPAGLYDTAFLDSAAGPPGAVSTLPANQRIKAIKVTIRVWDYKTEMARQVSIIQDL